MSSDATTTAMKRWDEEEVKVFNEVYESMKGGKVAAMRKKFNRRMVSVGNEERSKDAFDSRVKHLRKKNKEETRF
ncbi:hypothetical protein Pcac1_g12170 [Phytophthora cactorum]|uniref:Myb-like domain-containing protein n=1 Tax=Phytophthora cactorum TaxID=29920 RepID=A0A329SYK2_9STRA|nr:hypothetical protein Pcac1_g12170 [Phytophthora cactorum]KAG2879554.1 hypothetical protein PC114_g22516 [Phytophthora cactorum]KAG2888275.1 hypothetical protein PC115_g20104 [Phytophthora cactorum]KAG2964584.1 hypothetical protein PC118_g20237 [Phytophthora cactorum]KAG2995845.1 hypothetical protein PC120_g21643 [Phytophthora cactorum]